MPNLAQAKKSLGLVVVISAALLLLLVLRASTAQLKPPDLAARQAFLTRLVAAARERTHHAVRYDAAYVRIPYPGGDVPADTGVCTDEVVRMYRAVGIDLQKEVHEDMEQNFSGYPRKWRWFTAHPDANIDHRRVPNLMVFFQPQGRNTWNYAARGRLCAGGDCYLGSWQRRASHRNSGGSEISNERALPDRA